MVSTTQKEAVEILDRLNALGLRQKDLADVLGLEANKVSKVKNGERRLTAGEVIKATQWLDNIERKRLPQSDHLPTRDASEGETVEIMQLDLRLSMGPGSELHGLDGYIDENPVFIDLGYIRSFTRTAPKWLRLAHGIGESMAPTLLNNDLVWIDTSQQVLNQQDRIWAISLYGAAAIKRLRLIGDGKVLVMSDNPDVPDQPVDAEDMIIAGRVLRFVRDI